MADNSRTNKDPAPPEAAALSGSTSPPTPRVAILREARTSLGLVELRRRWSPSLERQVFEILLDNKLMMSSAVHVSETALAQRGLAATPNSELKVLVGGLGLGCTALRALADGRTRSVRVVEYLQPVLDWHAEGVFPWSVDFLKDDRVELVQDDFFAHLTRPASDDSRYDLILVDIDDAPDHLWHGDHARFYTEEGLRSAASHLRPGGAIAFWFATQPSDAFMKRMGRVLQTPLAETVEFYDPSLHHDWAHFLVIARR